ncbi:MAG: hypothetical protein ACSHXK_04195 [Oceanococcus sp.]
MTQSKGFWLFNNIGLMVFYIAVSIFAFNTGADMSHPAVMVAVLILAAHVLEIPLAFKVLAPQQPSALRVVLGTTLFGFTWWLPAKRGIYSVA